MVFIVRLPKSKVTIRASSLNEAEQKANARFKRWQDVRYAHKEDIVKDFGGGYAH